MAYDREEVLKYHFGGKVAVALPKPLRTKDDLCLAYTPGVAHAVKAIAEDPKAAWDVTAKRNLVAVPRKVWIVDFVASFLERFGNFRETIMVATETMD